MKKILLLPLFLSLSHASDFFSELREQRESGLTTDFSIVSSENQEFRCHKNVLMAFSKVFKGMLSHDSKESRENKISLLYPSLAIEIIIDLIYHGDFLKSLGQLDWRIFYMIQEFAKMHDKESIIDILKSKNIEFNIEDIDEIFDIIAQENDGLILDKIIAKNRQYLKSYLKAQVQFIKSSSIGSMCFSKDEKCLFVNSDDASKVKVYSILSDQFIGEFNSKFLYISRLSNISSDGKKIITSSNHGASVIDIISSKVLFVIENNNINKYSLFSQDDEVIIVDNKNNRVDIINAHNGQLFFSLNMNRDICYPTMSTNNKFFAFEVRNTTTVEIWEMPPQELYINKYLFLSSNPKTWIYLRYYLSNYFKNLLQEQNSYFAEFVSSITAEKNNIKNMILNNEWLEGYMKRLFLDYDVNLF